MKSKAASALLNMSSCDGPIRLKILQDKAVPALLTLSKGSGEETRKGCAVALCNLLCHVDTQSNIVEMGALPAFNALATAEDESIKARCAVTLFSLACDESMGSKMVEEGGLSPLLALASANNRDTRRQCVAALQVSRGAGRVFEPGRRMLVACGR